MWMLLVIRVAASLMSMLQVVKDAEGEGVSVMGYVMHHWQHHQQHVGVQAAADANDDKLSNHMPLGIQGICDL